ncbi:MAG: hypothetical protein Kow00129_17510 [Thermoleophilia bacterium]
MVDVLETFLPPEVREFVDYKEWSIKSEEGVRIFTERGGKVIPTLCVDGDKVFESIIPTLEDLYGALLPRARNEQQRRSLEQAFAEAEEDYA